MYKLSVNYLRTLQFQDIEDLILIYVPDAPVYTIILYSNKLYYSNVYKYIRTVNVSYLEGT